MNFKDIPLHHLLVSSIAIKKPEAVLIAYLLYVCVFFSFPESFKGLYSWCSEIS